MKLLKIIEIILILFSIFFFSSAYFLDGIIYKVGFTVVGLCTLLISYFTHIYTSFVPCDILSLLKYGVLQTSYNKYLQLLSSFEINIVKSLFSIPC